MATATIAPTSAPANNPRPSITTDVERIKEAKLNITLLEDTPLDLTHKEAERILNCATFKAERKVDDPHVQELYDEMANGRFRPEQVRIALCWYNNVLYRVNGQHTCWARLFMPATFPAVSPNPAGTCFVRQLVYKATSEEELRKLYGVFDPSWSARSTSHLLKVLLCDTPAAEGVALTWINQLSTGFKFWNWEGSRTNRRRQGHNEIAIAIEKRADLFQKVAKFYAANGVSASHVRNRQGVIGAMFECFDRRPTLAEEFWKPVCDGLNFKDANDPRYKLMRWLQERVVDVAGNKTKKAVTSEEMYRVCIVAWNHWRADTTVTTLRQTVRRVRAT